MIGRKCQKELGGGLRRRRLSFRARLIFGVVLGLVGVVGVPLGVSAVQNIFTGFGQVTDIQYMGEDIDMVVYRGSVLWEREPEIPPGSTGSDIQVVTTENCPAVRTRVRDARDDATYWVQKMADGKCWMLTNLAYGGGGANTYGDTKSITLNSTNTGATYTAAQYYIPTDSNRTTGTTDPSTSTNGTGQYGYLYNWCAAMGAQTGTDACSSSDTTDVNTNISICPSGWRLPSGDASATAAGNDFGALNTAENNGSTSSPSGLLSSWLGQYAGFWSNSFIGQGGNGYYWSSTQYSGPLARTLSFSASYVNPGSSNNNKNLGFAVRCVAV